MSRATNILEGIVSAVGHGLKTASPYLSVGGAAAGVGVQSAIAKHQREKKVKQAGYGDKLQRAKNMLTLARARAAKTGYLSKKRRQSVHRAKAHKKRIMNKGLHAFAQKTASED